MPTTVVTPIHPVCATLAAGALLLVAGCASDRAVVQKQAQHVAQALPFPSEEARIPACLGLEGDIVQGAQPERALHDLQPGASCWFIVQPAAQLGMTGNGTGVALDPQCHYMVTVLDADDPRFWPGHPVGKVPTSAAVEGPGTAITKVVMASRSPAGDPAVSLMAVASESSHAMPVGHGARLSRLKGELSFYVDDARGSYDNRHYGKVLLAIRHEAGDIGSGGCARD